MLLLLLNNLFEMPKGDQSYRLRDLFEINIGLIEDKFNKMTIESKEEVMFINLKASKDDNSQVSNLTIIDYHTRNLIDYKELERRLPIRDIDEDFENDAIIYNWSEE